MNRRQFLGGTSTLAMLLGLERGGAAIGRDVYGERLDRELEIIRRRDLTEQFLAAARVTRFARERGIGVSPGRGAAPSSLVAFGLGITGVDPVAFGLLFERFVNPLRDVRADICLDVAADRRLEVTDFITNTLGFTPTSVGDATVYPEPGLELNGLSTLNALHGPPASPAASARSQRARSPSTTPSPTRCSRPAT
jgi:hypothetical protein